jgi:hypothetical protein
MLWVRSTVARTDAASTALRHERHRCSITLEWPASIGVHWIDSRCAAVIPALTPDAEAGEIVGYKTARSMIVKMILDSAPPADVVGGHAALRVAIDQLLDAWEALADDKRANAERLYYGYRVCRSTVMISNICHPAGRQIISANLQGLSWSPSNSAGAQR